MFGLDKQRKHGDSCEVELTDKGGNKLTRKLYRGIFHGNFEHLEENIENLDKLKVRDDDILLSAHIKCGTHWVWEIISMLQRGTADYMETIKEEVFVEMICLETINDQPSPRIINTHLRPGDLSNAPDLINGRCKVIFVTRNPKDALVSEYKHKVNCNGYSGSFPDYFDLVLDEKQPFLTWIDYTLLWEKYFNDNPQVSVLYLYYEDLKEDLEKGVRSLAKYLSLDVDDELIKAVTDKCTFDKMKEGKIAQKPKERNMYRKGQVGSWKQHFTVAMSERYDKIFAERTKGSKIAERIRFTL